MQNGTDNCKKNPKQNINKQNQYALKKKFLKAAGLQLKHIKNFPVENFFLRVFI